MTLSARPAKNRRPALAPPNAVTVTLGWSAPKASLKVSAKNTRNGVSDASRRIEHENAVDPDARDLVMRGWAWWYAGPQSPKSAQEALGAFERALEIDPRSSDARIGIARLLVGKLTTGWTSSSFQQETVQQAVARSERLLFEAIESDSNQPMAYAVLGLLRRTQGRLAESRRWSAWTVDT
jgi:adenylate cyclase